MRNLLTYRRFIVLLGMFLGIRALAFAQTPAPQIVLTQERVAQTTTTLRMVSTPVPIASFLLSPNRGESPAHFSRLFAGAYEPGHNLERLPQIQQTKNLIFTRSSLSLVQLWSGRLQLETFQSTFRTPNLRSVHLSGLSVSFHFGRDARTGNPNQAWHTLSRFLLTALN
jgi:hypothetical protein